MNRFVKKNIWLFSFLGVALVAALILAYMVTIAHTGMKKYIKETEDLRNEIKTLIGKKPAPVAGNLDRIRNDIRRYKVKVKDIRNSFGHPYRIALTKFADTMGIKLDEFENRFNAFWEINKKSGTTRDQVYRMFKASFKGYDKWDQAMREFTIEARKISLENIDENNVDEIFLGTLGLSRNLSFSTVKCDSFMRSIRFKLIDIFGEKQVGLGSNVSYFSFDFQTLADKNSIPDIVKTWDIIADLARRIANSRIYQLDSFEKSSIVGRKDGNYTYYRFKISVSGNLDSVRRLIKLLYDAYEDNRVYIIRGISISKKEDLAQKIIDDSDLLKNEAVRFDAITNSAQGIQSGAPDASGLHPQPENAKKTSAAKREEDPEKGIPFNERTGYGVPLIGKDKLCNATLDIDYVVYSAEELN
ncbi:MAG: hypothetical protein WC071_07790 [Victivallaceae bacterium]